MRSNDSAEIIQHYATLVVWTRRDIRRRTSNNK